MSQNFAKKIQDHGLLDGLSDDDHSFYPKGLVAYDELTASQGTITGTGITNLTGLTTTFTASSSRIYRVQMKAQFNANASTEMKFWITFDGGSNYERFMTLDLTGSGITFYSEGTRYFDGTLNGSITAQCAVQTSAANAIDHQAAATVPSFIAIEDVGPT